MGLSKTEIGFVFSSPALTGTFTSALTGMLVCILGMLIGAHFTKVLQSDPRLSVAYILL